MKRYGLLLLGLCAALAGQSRAGVSYPAPAEPQQTAALAAIREYALNYSRSLPDYSCTRETQWTVNSPGEFPRSGETETQVGYVGHKELERLITINGRAAQRVKSRDFPAVVSHGEFGNLLGRIFDPAIPVKLAWARWDMIGGRRMCVFA